MLRSAGGPAMKFPALFIRLHPTLLCLPSRKLIEVF